MEAYKALEEGDFDKMASYFNTFSPKNKAVFWSGDKEAAGIYAKSINGTILEQTQAGEVFDGMNTLGDAYPEWGTESINDQRRIWIAISEKYAREASGDVTKVGPYDGWVWTNKEYPILLESQDNGVVNNIIRK